MGALNYRMVDNAKSVPLIPPKDYNGVASATTDPYVCMKNYNSITFYIQTGAWAGGTGAVTLLQATAVAGTAAKALAFTKVWKSTLLADTQTETAVTSNTFNLDTALTLYQIEIKADDLDVQNGFDCITCHVATPGSNADLYNILAVLTHPRYAQANTPSAIID